MSANSLQASQELCAAIEAFCGGDYDENMGLLSEDSEILPIINDSNFNRLKSFSEIVQSNLKQPKLLPEKLQAIIKKLKLLITEGANVDFSDKDGMTPLHRAIQFSNAYM